MLTFSHATYYFKTHCQRCAVYPRHTLLTRAVLTPKKVEILSLGDELLVGIRLNSHLTYLGGELVRHGLELGRDQELPDDVETIRAAAAEALTRADLIITTGGLGPTSDDVTVDALARALGRRMRHDASVEETIRSRFARRGLTPTENNLRQCRIIEGAEVLLNPNGTAPGQWIEADGKIIAVLPGPTGEMCPMFADGVLPRLIRMGWASERIPFLQIRTTGLGESQVAATLDPIFEPFADRLRVAYCAHEGVVDIRLAATGEDALPAGELPRIGERCRSTLGSAFAAFGDRSVAGIILTQLRRHGKTLAVAESCTGGLLAARFTEVPGSSKAFNGGVVCYRNDAKTNLLGVPGCLLEQHGAVSPECAVAMATGAAEVLEADYALSITGFAGPEGGNEPPGTVYIGYHSPIGVWASKIHHTGTRDAVRERGVNAALDFMRRKLRKYEMHELLECLRC